MSKPDASTILGTMPKSVKGWDGAIYDAERKIGEAKGHVSRLRAALSFFRECRERGEPFPGQPKPKRSQKAA